MQIPSALYEKVKRGFGRKNSAVTLCTTSYFFFKLYLSILFFEPFILLSTSCNKELFSNRTASKKFNFKIPL